MGLESEARLCEFSHITYMPYRRSDDLQSDNATRTILIDALTQLKLY